MNNQDILQALPIRLRENRYIKELDFEQVREVRLRVGQVIEIRMIKEEFYENDKFSNGTYSKYLDKNWTKKLERVRQRDIREMMEYISRYSLFSFENEMKNGYITIAGGHRIGIAGKVIVEDGNVKNFQYISSINIRVAHEILGCGESVIPYIYDKGIYHSVLIVSPPGCGKTTLLRDVIRITSSGTKEMVGQTVGVVDERSEIGGCFEGVSQNNLGIRTDILDACPKAEGMLMLLRSMSPDIIAVDEIGTREDMEAVEQIMHCGITVIATVHGGSLNEIQKNPYVESIIKNKGFQRYIILDRKNHIGNVMAVYDGDGMVLFEDSGEHDGHRGRNLYGDVI